MRAEPRLRRAESGSVAGKLLPVLILGCVGYLGWGLWPALSTYYTVFRATRNMATEVANGKSRRAARRLMLRTIYSDAKVVLTGDALSITVKETQVKAAVRLPLRITFPFVDRAFRPTVTVKSSARKVK